MKTYLLFTSDGKPIIQPPLTRLSPEMAQELIQACLDADINALKSRLDVIDPNTFQEWERDQCEHELTIMRNIYEHRTRTDHDIPS